MGGVVENPEHACRYNSDTVYLCIYCHIGNALHTTCSLTFESSQTASAAAH